MAKKKDATFSELIALLDKEGWEKGFRAILEIHKSLERQHDYLISGDLMEQNRAARMMPQIAKQDETIVRLQIFAEKERGITLDGRH